MRYDFDRMIPRVGTAASKWGVMQDEKDPTHSKPTDIFSGENAVIPMWVADMDFPSPQPVVDALVARAQHGIYGYTFKTVEYDRAVVNWMRKRHGWEIQPEWICPTPGVVPALNLLVRAFAVPGDKVIVQPPVYYPFFSAIQNNDVTIVHNPLRRENGRYTMDFDHLKNIAPDPHVKLAILCSPHNPIGRVWTHAELERFGEICLENNIIVIADEIHGDLIYPGYHFVPFTTLGERFAQNAIICTAPSKTFNLAGLKMSNIIVPNPRLRAQFDAMIHKNSLTGLNIFGTVAVQAAYNFGEEWLDQLLVYLDGNLRFLRNYLAEHIPQITLIEPEGTYLVWLDCRRLGLDKNELRRLFLNEARVFLDDGPIFGPGGEGFERMNIACPRAILAEALARVSDAIQRRSVDLPR